MFNDAIIIVKYWKLGYWRLAIIEQCATYEAGSKRQYELSDLGFCTTLNINCG